MKCAGEMWSGKRLENTVGKRDWQDDWSHLFCLVVLELFFYTCFSWVHCSCCKQLLGFNPPLVEQGPLQSHHVPTPHTIGVEQWFYASHLSESAASMIILRPTGTTFLKDYHLPFYRGTVCRRSRGSNSQPENDNNNVLCKILMEWGLWWLGDAALPSLCWRRRKSKNQPEKDNNNVLCRLLMGWWYCEQSSKHCNRMWWLGDPVRPLLWSIGCIIRWRLVWKNQWISS